MWRAVTRRGCHLQLQDWVFSCPAAGAQPRDLVSPSQAGGHGRCFAPQPASVSIAPTYRTCKSTDSQVPFSPLAVRARYSLHFDKVLVQLILLWALFSGWVCASLCLASPFSPCHPTWEGPWSDDGDKADTLSFHMPWQVDSSWVQIQKWRAQTVPLSKGSHLGTRVCSPN